MVTGPVSVHRTMSDTQETEGTLSWWSHSNPPLGSAHPDHKGIMGTPTKRLGSVLPETVMDLCSGSCLIFSLMPDFCWLQSHISTLLASARAAGKLFQKFKKISFHWRINSALPASQGDPLCIWGFRNINAATLEPEFNRASGGWKELFLPHLYSHQRPSLPVTKCRAWLKAQRAKLENPMDPDSNPVPSSATNLHQSGIIKTTTITSTYWVVLALNEIMGA